MDYHDAYSILENSDGDYIMAGRQGNSGSFQIHVIRTDTSGEVINTCITAISGLSKIFSIQQTADDGYVLAGSADGDHLIVKMSSEWLTEWITLIDYSRGGAFDVKQTKDGQYILLSTNLTSSILTKIDVLGNVVWAKEHSMPGSISNEGKQFVETSDGGYLYTGATSADYFQYSLMLVKTDSVGDTLWTKKFPTYSQGFAITAYDDSSYAIVGYKDNGTYLIRMVSNILLETADLVFKENRIKVYPQPIESTGVIEFENPNRVNYNMTLINMQGVQVQEISGITSNQVNLHKGSLSAGAYIFVLCPDKGECISEKIIFK
ncbi:MAG: T9SS type A sorting domain-containing protein [Flavobacteriales bacterium]|nr:T9SS type A sorting domain-containing protein [Flavobacteriales bacterium]